MGKFVALTMDKVVQVRGHLTPPFFGAAEKPEGGFETAPNGARDILRHVEQRHLTNGTDVNEAEQPI